ncbi:MAG TPA: polyphenol oxidase family protein [Gemmatimonadaceae bacterium]|nr:polyphenol oxidase family protein [Gemmatimonadaceae bacterium]
MAAERDPVGAFATLGVVAFTTTRDAGDYGIPPDGLTDAARMKWEALIPGIPGALRLASAKQVHGKKVLTHGADWSGWKRVDGADGHVTNEPGTALAVTVADCVPVFLAHASGAVGLLHAGWRGVAAGMLASGVEAMAALGAEPGELHVHLGPSISGRNYEVGADVYRELTGWETARARRVDLRALLAEQARALGIRRVSASPFCTWENADQFYSHRRGDAGRQIAVIVAPSLPAR